MRTFPAPFFSLVHYLFKKLYRFKDCGLTGFKVIVGGAPVTTENQVSDRLTKVPVKAHTWVIFPNEGLFPSTLQETMAKVYSEWLPTSNYEVINAPTFSFTKMDEHKKDYAYSEIWIPVRKK